MEAGDRPVPRKLVITSKTLNSAPQYTLQVKDWKADIDPHHDAFASEPPAGDQKLGLDALIELDELPQGAPPAANQ